jgi:hypothetical protein
MDKKGSASLGSPRQDGLFLSHVQRSMETKGTSFSLLAKSRQCFSVSLLQKMAVVDVVKRKHALRVYRTDRCFQQLRQRDRIAVFVLKGKRTEHLIPLLDNEFAFDLAKEQALNIVGRLGGHISSFLMKPGISTDRQIFLLLPA